MHLTHNFKGRFATFHTTGDETISHDALAELENGLNAIREDAMTSPDAVIRVQAIEDIARLFGLDIDLMAGATGDGTQQVAL